MPATPPHPGSVAVTTTAYVHVYEYDFSTGRPNPTSRGPYMATIATDGRRIAILGDTSDARDLAERTPRYLPYLPETNPDNPEELLSAFCYRAVSSYNHFSDLVRVDAPLEEVARQLQETPQAN